MSIRQQFEAAAQRARRPIPVHSPALGLVYVKLLSVAEVQERRNEAANATPIASLLARAIVDEAGQPVFDAAKEADIGLLCELSFADASPILEAINGANGLGQGAAEQALKNSPPSAGSSSV
jgi:hypothetical protein